MKTKLSRPKWPIVLTVIGVGVTASAVISLYFSFADPGISIPVPGETTFAITTPGNYTLWSEVSGSFDGKLMTFPTGLPPGVMIKIIRKTDGTVVPLQTKWPTTRADSGGVIRLAIGTVRFDSAGAYQISTEGLEEKRGLHLDSFEFHRVFLAGLLVFAGPPFIVAGLAWGLFMVLTSRGTQPNQTIQATAGRSDA